MCIGEGRWRRLARFRPRTPGIGRLLAIGLIVVPGISQAAVPSSSVFSEMTAVSEAELANMRGGFFHAAGFTVRFGISIEHFINGELASRLTLDGVEIGKDMVTSPQLTAETFGGSGSGPVRIPILSPEASGIIQSLVNGEASIAMTSDFGGFMSLIQNNLDNQTVAQVATINLTTSNLVQAIRLDALQSLLNSQRVMSLPR